MNRVDIPVTVTAGPFLLEPHQAAVLSMPDRTEKVQEVGRKDCQTLGGEVACQMTIILSTEGEQSALQVSCQGCVCEAFPAKALARTLDYAEALDEAIESVPLTLGDTEVQVELQQFSPSRPMVETWTDDSTRKTISIISPTTLAELFLFERSKEYSARERASKPRHIEGVAKRNHTYAITNALQAAVRHYSGRLGDTPARIDDPYNQTTTLSYSFLDMLISDIEGNRISPAPKGLSTNSGSFKILRKARDLARTELEAKTETENQS
jgi:hypothetical protein